MARTGMLSNLKWAARMDIESYLNCLAIKWLYGEGMSTEDHCRQIDKLQRIGEIADTIGWDEVRMIWNEVDEKIKRCFANEVRLVVPNPIVEAWLAGIKAVSCPDVDSEITDELGASVDDEQGLPEQMVLNGMRLMLRAQWDRDLHDQLGLPECFYGEP
jgi:hypothetical protein